MRKLKKLICVLCIIAFNILTGYCGNDCIKNGVEIGNCTDNGFISGGSVSSPSAKHCLSSGATKSLIWTAGGVVDSEYKKLRKQKYKNCPKRRISDKRYPGVTPTYTWTISGSDTASGSGISAEIITDIPGSYNCVFVASINRDCSPSPSSKILYGTSADLYRIDMDQASLSVCNGINGSAGGVLNLTSDSHYSGNVSWSSYPAGISGSGNMISISSSLAPGQYSVTARMDNSPNCSDGCVVDVIKVDISQNKVVKCVNNTSASLNITSDSYSLGGYRWSSSPVGISGSGTSLTFNPSALTPGTYTVRAESSSLSTCYDMCTVIIQKVDIEQAAVFKCVDETGASLNLTVDSHSPDGYIWSSIPPGISGIGSSITYDPISLNPGIYNVTAESYDLNNCYDECVVSIMKVDLIQDTNQESLCEDNTLKAVIQPPGLVVSSYRFETKLTSISSWTVLENGIYDTITYTPDTPGYFKRRVVAFVDGVECISSEIDVETRFPNNTTIAADGTVDSQRSVDWTAASGVSGDHKERGGWIYLNTVTCTYRTDPWPVGSFFGVNPTGNPSDSSDEYYVGEYHLHATLRDANDIANAANFPTGPSSQDGIASASSDTPGLLRDRHKDEIVETGSTDYFYGPIRRTTPP